MGLLTSTFGHAVKHDPWNAKQARDGGDVHDAPASGAGGGSAEERVRELAEVEARLQVGRHDPRVVLRRVLRRRLDHHLRRVVHLHVHVYVRVCPRTNNTRTACMHQDSS